MKIEKIIGREVLDSSAVTPTVEVDVILESGAGRPFLRGASTRRQ